MTKYTLTADLIAMFFCLFTDLIFFKRAKRAKGKTNNIEKYHKFQIVNLVLTSLSIVILVIATIMNLSNNSLKLNAVGVTLMLSFLLFAGLIMPALTSTFTIHLYNRVHKRKRKTWNVISIFINGMAVFLSFVIIFVFAYNLATGDFSQVKDFSSLIVEINSHVGAWFTLTELLVTNFLWIISTFIVLINSFWMGLLALNVHQLSVANRKHQQIVFKQSAKTNIDILALENNFNFNFKKDLISVWEEEQIKNSKKKVNRNEKVKK